MAGSRAAIAIPILIMTLGTGWLLTTHEAVPGVNWVWVLGLAVVGVLCLVLGGVDKVTIVVGPFLLVATVLSLLHQTGRLALDTAIPCLVILIGVLTLVSRLLPIPPPRWFTGSGNAKDDADGDG